MSFGFTVFLILFLMAFWVLLFLMAFVIPFWIHISVVDKLKPKNLVDEDTSSES